MPCKCANNIKREEILLPRRFNGDGHDLPFAQRSHFMHFRVFKPWALMKLISAIVCFGKQKWRLYLVPLLVPTVKIMFKLSFSTSYEKLIQATDRIEVFVENLLSEKTDKTAV